MILVCLLLLAGVARYFHPELERRAREMCTSPT